jgi:hypothetical protein
MGSSAGCRSNYLVTDPSLPLMVVKTLLSFSVGNPWQGFVPYLTESVFGQDAGALPGGRKWKREEQQSTFPHSMENQYFAWSDIMGGWNKFNL